MPEQLFPVFEIPSIVQQETESRDEAFYPGPLFDFDAGDYVRDGQHQILMVDGLDTYMLWCIKALKTQLGACASYPDFGIDVDGALSEANNAAICSAMERTITEALMRNPRTERVYSFEFVWTANVLAIVFIVKPKDLDAFDLSMNVIT